MMQKTLTQALLLWRIILPEILAVLSFVIWLGRRAGTAETVADAAAGTEDGAGVQKERGKAGTWTIVFWDSCGGSDSAAGIYPRALRA